MNPSTSRPTPRSAAVSDQLDVLLRASLDALVNPPGNTPQGLDPRDVLIGVSAEWADDGTAWRLARHLLPATETYIADLDRRLKSAPDDAPLARLGRRARYAHFVAARLYQDLRSANRTHTA